MKVLLTIIWLGCICASHANHDEKSIEQLLAANTKELNETQRILRHIDATNDQIKSSIEQQRVWLGAIKNVDGLLAKLNLFVDAQGVVLREALHNITLKSGQSAERVSKELGGLARLQLLTKQQIGGLEQKLDAHQKHVLQNARSIDNNILELTKLITRAVLPQLNGLQCSFDSLETSHINIEVELKSLARIKDVSEESNVKLNVLSEQLVGLNHTQDARLAVLTHSLSQLKPVNTWQIERALRELIISQKRIELDLELCEKRSSPHHPKPPSPTAYPAYELESPAAPSKQMDLVQVWNAKDQGQPNVHAATYYTSAYGQAPELKPKPAKPSNPSYGHYAGPPAKPDRSSSSRSAYSVSWQQPLPWEAASPYQSAPKPKPNPQPWHPEPHYQPAPAPAPKPYQPSSVHRRPLPNQKPCAHPPRHSAPAGYGPPAPAAQSYARPGAKPAQPIPQERHSLWYGAPNSQSDGY